VLDRIGQDNTICESTWEDVRRGRRMQYTQRQNFLFWSDRHGDEGANRDRGCACD
jgi:hypothetical protein